MPTYEFSLPDGRTFEVDSPSELNQEQLSYVAKNHQQYLEPQKQQSLGDEFIEGAKGTAAALGDFASGMLKVPASALLAAGGKIADPSLPLQTHWEAAQQAMEDTFPSIGSELGVQNNLGYTAPLKPFELYGQGANYIAKQASMGNKDVEGALNIAANFLPIPFVGKAGKLTKAGIEKIDPALRNVKVEKPTSERMSNLDAVEAQEAAQAAKMPEVSPGERVMSDMVDSQLTGWNEPIRNNAPNPDAVMPWMQEQLAKDRYNKAQEQVDFRNKQQEFETARQTSLDFNAAERQRQLHADTGFAKFDAERTAKLQEEVSTLQQKVQQLDTERQQVEQRNESRQQQLEATQKQEQAQRVLEERQRQLEFEVQKQHSLDFNAAERARQENAPVLGLEQKQVTDPFKDITTPSSVKLPEVVDSTITKTPNFNIPKSQRGGINFGEISKALGNAKSAISNVFDRLPGTSEIGKMLEQVYPDVDKLRQQIIDAKVNSKQYLNKLQSGSSLSYIQTKDPLIRAVSTIMQTAAKRVDNAIQQHVKPIEHALDNLRKTDPQAFNDLGDVFKREMLGRKTYTPEQLEKAGFTPEQVSIYTQMRDLYDKSYKVQNAVLEQQGRPTLTKQEYYMASRWEGDWGSNVYGKDGKLLWVVRGGSKAEVEAGLKHLKESGIDFDANKSTPTYTRKDPGKWVDYPAAYSAMLQHLTETNPMSKAAREAYETMSADEVFKTLGQNKHFLEKANIRGFAGDRPWRDKLTDTTDMFFQQMQYNKNAFEWAEMQNAGKMADQLLADETIRRQSPDSVEYAQGVVDRYTGKGDHQLFTKLENSIAKALPTVSKNGVSFGRSTQDLRNITAGAKSLWIIQKLATNLGNTFIQNPLQFVNSLAWHTDLSTSGYKHNALKTFANSFADTMAGLSQHYGEYLGLKGFGSPSKFGQEAINYARSNGLLEMNVFDEHTDLRTAKLVKDYQATLGRLQIESDKLSRFAAFMGFAHHLQQSGKFADKMDLFREAEHYTRGSMVDNSFKERPFIVQDTGVVGTLGSALQGYSLNYLNQLGGFARKASKGNILPLATFLATSAGLSGISGVTAFNWMGDMYDKLRDSSPDMYASLPDYRQTMIDLEGDGSFYRTALTRGLPAAITGLDIGKKFESSLPSTPIVGMGEDIRQQALDVGSALSEGDLTKAAYAVAPSGLGKGMLEVHSDLFKSPYSDKYSDTKGNFGRGIFRDDKDKLFKSLGLPTIAEARQKEVILASEKDRQNNSQATKYFSNRIINAWGKGKNPEGDIAKLAKINPEALQQLQANQEQYIKQATMPYQALQAEKAKSSASAKRLIDYGTQ